MSKPTTLLPGQLVFITSRIEEGLPLVSTHYMELILWGILARAQHLYPVTICGFVIMGNHIHLLIVVHDPQVVVDFIDRFKTESSHAINRLLGRRKRTVWCDDYDDQSILTREDAISKFIYIYANPQKAGLVDTIEEYPGVSSWPMLLNDQTTKECPWIRRPMLKPLRKRALSPEQDAQFTEALRGEASPISHTLTLTPFAWLSCFKEDGLDVLKVKEEIIRGVREEEASLRGKRKLPCIGAEKLRRQSLDKQFTPKKFSKRMWCICRDIPLRISFINFIKRLRAEGREVYRRWKMGDRTAVYPVGLFPPRFPTTANLPYQALLAQI